MGQGVFLGTYEKQLDGKRRLQIPEEFRTAANGAEASVFCLQSPTDDCLEAGGEALMAEYVARIQALPFGSDDRTALEEVLYGGQRVLSYDVSGRITLPAGLCQDAGLKGDVVIVGMGERFRIWDREAWTARRPGSRSLAGRVMKSPPPLSGGAA